MGHGEGDVLPVAVGQDVLLLGYPLLCDFEATTAAGFGLATLAEESGMDTVWRAGRGFGTSQLTSQTCLFMRVSMQRRGMRHRVCSKSFNQLI